MRHLAWNTGTLRLLTGLAAWLAAITSAPIARAEDASQQAILQVFEARWDTIDDRMADIFVAGYGRLWLPPPSRADSGDHSVGYDVFDRFDLGGPRNETLYGTENGLKQLVQQAHLAGVRVNTDFIANHNGFSDSRTFDSQGTADPSDDVYWNESGGYPGFLGTLSPTDDPNGVGDPDGDYHPLGWSGQEYERLAGLIDIAQEKNYQYIRTPVNAGDPLNIPAGQSGIFGRPPANTPDPNNARFYPDQDLGGTTVWDPALGTNVTLYDFNTDAPLSGDAYAENATGLLVRNLRWMIQEVGVDGFRFDAARHFPRWVLNYLDQGAFLAKQEPLLDGSPDHVYSFIETGGDTDQFVAGFIRKDIDNNNLSQLGGNRDALDFNLFFALRDNLQENGLVNDWRNIKNRSVDIVDDGLANNGTQGVAFAQSHDDGPSQLNDLAHAYLLMRPGQALVYLNAKEFGEERPFPQDGRGDALGGLYGDAVTKLVNLRNSHGRGDYLDRTPAADEKELLIYERENSALVVLNNRGDSGYDQRTVQTSFAPGTPLVELTGNASDPAIDQLNDLPEVVLVNPDGTVDVRAPRNRGANGVRHDRGYLIYGVAAPQGRMQLTDAGGGALVEMLPGAVPTAGQGGAGGPSDDYFNGTTRLTDITVVRDDTFQIRVETDAVVLPGGIRDPHADGDHAQFKIDGGLDANGSGAVDHVAAGSLAYGFEEFTEVSSPGYQWQAGANVGAGEGLFAQTIDATELAEGRHYLTSRVYRHRDAATGGDGGPAVFTDFRQVIYVDRLAPESRVESFEPYASDPTNPNNRDLIIESLDGTAERVHVFVDFPAALDDQAYLDRAAAGEGQAGYYDHDRFAFGVTGVTNGNHVVTVLTIEPTGTYNVQRFAGFSPGTEIGLGIGDANADGQLTVSDLIGFGGFEPVMRSQNATFRATLDATGDGRIDARDLVALGGALVEAGASPDVLAEYDAMLLRRADLDQDGDADADDLRALVAAYGSGAWDFDLNVDGTTDAADSRVFVTQLLAATPGDYNLDGRVDAADYTTWRDSAAAADQLADGDFDGDVDAQDLAVWAANFGVAQPHSETSSTAAPEPSTLGITTALSACLLVAVSARSRATR